MNETEGEKNWLKILNRCSSHRIQLGLERIKQVGERAGVFTFSCPIVTVAGTNGKGSTVAALAKLLQTAGKKVGTYTSPHLLRINERIQINGKCVTDTQLGEAIEVIEHFRAQVPLTFFELTTLAALHVFQQADLDVLIMEVGLGGRLDAVNALDPTLAIITSIGYDHQEYLGATLESIAAEKAGIFRAGIPVVISEKATISTLLKQAQSLQVALYEEGKHFGATLDGKWYLGSEVIELANSYLPVNSVCLAFAAYTIARERELLPLPPLREVVKCLADAKMVGRFQQMTAGQVKVILDVGHNPDASNWLADKLKGLQPTGKVYAVWASLTDKDLPAIVKPLTELITTWYLGELGVERSASCEKLSDALRQQGIKAIQSFCSIPEAFMQAVVEAQKEDYIVVFGSFYTVGAVLERMGKDSPLENYGLFN